MRQGEVHDQPDHHGRQAHHGVQHHDRRIAPPEARQRDRRAKRHADHGRQQHGREADRDGEAHDREQRRIARQNEVQRGEMFRHRATSRRAPGEGQFEPRRARGGWASLPARSKGERMKRWKHRPEGSTWGDWGEDDQLGRLNLITPKKVLEGIDEVKAGRSFCLSLPLDFPGGNVLNARRLPPVLSPTGDENGWRFNFLTNTVNPLFQDVACDDRVILTLQYSTQWDTLAHVGGLFDADGDGVPEPLYYNGYKAGSDVVGPQVDAGRDGCGHLSYAHKLGVENMAAKAIQGRAVMVDLEKHYGRDHKYVSYDDFKRVLDADKIVVEPGDMLLLYTGFSDEIMKMNKKVDPERVHAMCCVLDGRDKQLLQWISDSQISALIADNYGVEAVPARPGPAGEHPMLPLHNHCLFKLGLNLGEIWWLKDLALWLREHGRSRFLLTAPPLRLPGAVGSPATPVATV